jgi:cytochrome c-type biogenesis protein CcmH
VIWLLLGALTLIVLLPFIVTLLRPARARGRAEADLALYRAQLAELDRERDAGRLDATAHQAATLEIQRRILAAPTEALPQQAGRGTPAVLAALVFLLPAAALGLYMQRGVPDMPAAPFQARQEMAEAEEALLANLRARLATIEPGSEQSRMGHVMLGNAERSRGRDEAAVAAWRTALQIRFDADLAGDVAEIEIERGDHIAASALLARALGSSPRDARLRFLTGLAEARAGRPANARSTWQALLADAPGDAPWRPVVERQLSLLP